MRNINKTSCCCCCCSRCYVKGEQFPTPVACCLGVLTSFFAYVKIFWNGAQHGAISKEMNERRQN